MRIAYISFEYPPDTAFGGIATYVFQVANALAQRNIEVEVFTASSKINKVEILKDINLIVHKIPYTKKKEFSKKIAIYFDKIHTVKPFDIIECAEFGADAIHIKKQFTTLPLVVKFHMSSRLIKQLNKSFERPKLKNYFKKILGIKQYKKEKDEEYILTTMANGLSSPSISLAKIMSNDWQITHQSITHIPNPYIPNYLLLNIDASVITNTITYTGRLEIRKGIINLIEAIKIVLKEKPETKFRLIGKSETHSSGKSMIDYIKAELGILMNNVEWIDKVPIDDIPKYLSQTDICVYPSIWENFPNTCLEAMAAARGIVASKEGGMNDMLQDVNGGILINPKNVTEIANGIIYLLNNPQERIKMALAARNKVVHYYGQQVITNTIEFYKKIISQSKC